MIIETTDYYLDTYTENTDKVAFMHTLECRKARFLCKQD